MIVAKFEDFSIEGSNFNLKFTPKSLKSQSHVLTFFDRKFISFEQKIDYLAFDYLAFPKKWIPAQVCFARHIPK